MIASASRFVRRRGRRCLKLMAYRLNLFHPVVIGLLGFCFLVYSFYCARTVLFLSRNEEGPSFSMKALPFRSAVPVTKTSKTAANNKTEIIPLLQNSTSVAPASISSKLNQTEAPGNEIAKKSIMIEVLQKIAARNSLGRSILTKNLYVDGFRASKKAPCENRGKNLKLLVAITSAPYHTQAREAIRLTWGHFALHQDVKILFFLGKTLSGEVSKMLDAEENTYGDLVRAEYLDSYSNLSLKTVSILNWSNKFCSSVKFLLKTDDDMFINMPKLLSFIDNHSDSKNAIFGRVAKQWKPIRNTLSKYYVSPEQYQPEVFPDFTTGPAYLITGDVINSLLKAALNKTYLKLEDVFITGTVAEEIKVKRIQVNEFLNMYVALKTCTIQKVISIHNVKYHEQFDIWKKLLDGTTIC